MKHFSAEFMEHVQDPRNRGTLPGADRIGVVGIPGRGPYFVLYLKLVGESIEAARFQCHGCGATLACGSVLTEYILGGTLESLRRLTVEDLILLLNGLPVLKRHSPEMAIAALRETLNERAPQPEEENP